MKKTLSLVKMLKTGLTLFVDLSLFIYLVVTSAVIGASEVPASGSVAFSLVLAWFIWVATVILSVLIVKNFKKGETERDLKMQVYYTFAMMLVGIFVLDMVNTLFLLMFALVLIEYIIREKAGDFDAAEPDATPEPPAEQTQAALDDEGVKETAAEEQVSQPKPARKVIAPKRRGDDAVPPEEGAQGEE